MKEKIGHIPSESDILQALSQSAGNVEASVHFLNQSVLQPFLKRLIAEDMPHCIQLRNEDLPAADVQVLNLSLKKIVCSKIVKKLRFVR